MTTTTTTITVQATYSAYSQEVPAAAWRDAGTARTWRVLERIYFREWRRIHPQQNAYSGHVRCVSDNGTVLDYGTAYRVLGGPEERLPRRYQ